MSKAAELANLIGNINAGGGGVNRNVIINGAMNVAQRGTSSTGLGASAGYFTVDRFRMDSGSTAGRYTMTQDSSAPSGFANSIKLACTTADTSIASSEYLILQQKLEGQNLQGFAKGTSDAKPFAVSFYVKGNASATYVAELFDNDNTRQVSKSFTVGTDWARVELSFPADTTGAFDDDNAFSLQLQIWLHSGSSYTSGTLSETWTSVTDANRAVGISSFFDSTSRTFFITGVQMEVGQNPTSFEIEPFERTLSKCQRYFQTWTQEASGFSTNNYGAVADSVMHGDTYAFMQYTHPVSLRATPALTFNGNFASNNSGADRALSSLQINICTPYITGFYGITPDNNEAGEVGYMRASNDGDASIFFDSEL